MPLDPRVQRFLTILAAGNPPDPLTATVAQRRQALAELMKLGGPEIKVGRIEDRTLPGPERLGVRIYSPLSPAQGHLPGLVYFHGGGLVAGSIHTHDSIARALASAAECRVVSVDYRLAPEHPFPAAINDAVTAVRHIATHADDFGVDAARMGVCGDSAGGTLAAACCQLLAQEGDTQLALQVLLCPILDYSRLTPSRRELAQGYLVDQATLDHDLLHYLPTEVEAADPSVSPLRATSLDGLPPAVIHTAEFDPLRDEAKEYCERLAATGISSTYHCHLGMIHLFYGLAGVIPYATTAMRQLGGEIRTALASPARVIGSPDTIGGKT